VRPRDKKQHSIELVCRIMRFFESAPVIVLLRPTGAVDFCILAPAGPSPKSDRAQNAKQIRKRTPF
ncbi:MAG: hypothetical protein QM235_05655, partial [Pseudomonadota bacterium]|nr:hypothetical protein [Pseudomonadota bacterium]